MRPILTSEPVNGAVGDIALLIDFKFVRRALFFDLGEADAPSAVPFHFSPRYLDRELEVRRQFETAFQGCTWAFH
jgi:hypothetical protein